MNDPFCTRGRRSASAPQIAVTYRKTPQNTVKLRIIGGGIPTPTIKKLHLHNELPTNTFNITQAPIFIQKSIVEAHLSWPDLLNSKLLRAKNSEKVIERSEPRHQKSVAAVHKKSLIVTYGQLKSPTVIKKNIF